MRLSVLMRKYSCLTNNRSLISLFCHQVAGWWYWDIVTQQNSILISAVGSLRALSGRDQIPYVTSIPTSLLFMSHRKVTAHWQYRISHLVHSLPTGLLRVLGCDGPWWAFMRHEYCHTLGQRQRNGNGLPGAGDKMVCCLENLKNNKANYKLVFSLAPCASNSKQCQWFNILPQKKTKLYWVTF